MGENRLRFALLGALALGLVMAPSASQAADHGATGTSTLCVAAVTACDDGTNIHVEWTYDTSCTPAPTKWSVEAVATYGDNGGVVEDFDFGVPSDGTGDQTLDIPDSTFAVDVDNADADNDVTTGTDTPTEVDVHVKGMLPPGGSTKKNQNTPWSNLVAPVGACGA